MEKLLQMVENKVTAVRDGKEVEISLHGIVPGNLVILRAGDIIPADCVSPKTPISLLINQQRNEVGFGDHHSLQE